MNPYQKPDDIKEYSGFNKILKSKFIQMMINKIDDGTFSDFFDDWRWIFSFSKQYKWAICFYTLMGILSSTLGLVSAVASKYMIDIITNRQIGRLWQLALLMIFSTVISLLFSSLVSRYATKLSIYVNNDIQASIFDKIIDADWLELSQYENGDLLNRFNNDVNTVASNAVSWLPNIIIALYTFAATFVVILHYDVIMAFIALLSAPFLLLASRFLMRKNREYRQKVLQMNSKLMSYESETFYNIDTIKSFGVMDHYSHGLRKWQKKLRDYTLDYNMFSIKTNIATSLVSTFVTFVAFGYCLFLLWSGRIEFGTMTLFLQQRTQLSNNFSSLVNIIPGMLNSSVSAHRIRELVELPREQHIAEESAQMARAAENGFAVRMSSVDFAYVENNKVLTDSDFLASPGEIIALVGPSGEGKTTMLRMILGLIHPDQGAVDLVDRDQNHVTINADTRRYFSYVPQGNTLMSGTIAENMRVVKEDATDEEIVEALKTACAWDFVQKLDDGIYSTLGTRGRGLSEGQAQRVSIARAVLRDAPVLLLDEATSALDVETERQVLRNIIRQHPNKTCIVTTHRPSVLNMCQRVYRVMDTKVTELDEAASSRMAQDF
ncbi:MAG: ABC transporter ATP-binding protein/permease [Clostridia bacterium]|nr:ABC transporter ATP-binding protein/permease [Clostridia bacterium]